ncbi:hypothetical protein M2156_008176 [Streptomyces sp. SAI-149]|nr:hypothetical protein [Streptomyces sp. SAI-119]MDH6501957.1 hypothetical protein [Streptomyces sp. SAI-149]
MGRAPQPAEVSTVPFMLRGPGDFREGWYARALPLVGRF